MIMKKIFLFCCFLLTTLTFFAQTDNEQVMDFAEVMPEYPGGINDFRADVAKNFSLPKEYLRSGGSGGIITTRFVIQRDGTIGEIIILKNIDGCDECEEKVRQALRAIKKKFSPGLQDGEPVLVWYTLPVELRVRGESENLEYHIEDEAPKKKFLNSLISHNISLMVDGYIRPKYDLAELNRKDITRLTVFKFADRTTGNGHMVYVELNGGKQFNPNVKRLKPFRKKDFNYKYYLDSDGNLLPGPPPMKSTPPPPPPPAPKQNTNSEKSQTLGFAEKMPEYPGGIKRLRKELDNNINIPKSVSKKFSGTQTIVLRFVVLEDGNTGEVRILKGINDCEKCSEAAVIAVKSLSKKFIPGELAGKKVKIWFTVPIRIDFD